ncbi:MAG: hypothetical protein M3R13_00815 [Armatimonadota bacterium]|nr:hypothetical protein [Armatimonadota bacterium]
MLLIAGFTFLSLAAQGLETVEVPLGKLPDSMTTRNIVVSPDGRRVAFIEKRGDKECVVIDGVADKLYDAIPSVPLTEAGPVRQIIFSPDSKRVAYVAKSGNRCFVVDNGAEGPPFTRIQVGAPTFSRDSKRMAYRAEFEATAVVVVDGKISKPYDDVYTTDNFFSNSGERVLFTAMRGKERLVVLDGTEIPEEHFHGEADFSENGHAVDVVKVDAGWIVYIDGMPSKPYRSVGNNIVFSSDNKRVLYQASDSAGDFLVIDGVEGKRYPNIAENSYSFTPDGKGYVFVVRTAAAAFVVLNEVEGESFSWVSDPVFSTDGSSMAYVAEEAGKRFVVQDVKKSEEYKDFAIWPHFFPKGNSLVFAGKNDREHLNVGKQVTIYDEIGTTAFSPDGKTFAYSARVGDAWNARVASMPAGSFTERNVIFAFSSGTTRHAAFGPNGNKTALFIDGLNSGSYDDIAFAGFSPVGNKLYWLSLTAGKWSVKSEQGTGKEYDEVVQQGSPAFDETGSLCFLAVRGKAIYRVRVSPAKSI